MQASTRSGSQGGRWARLWACAGLLAVLCAAALPGSNVMDPKLTTPERLALFDDIGASEKVQLLEKICSPENKADIKQYKIPDFLIKVLKNDAEDSRVREAALNGMVALIQKDDNTLKSVFIPALKDVLGGNSSTLVQEYVLKAAPAMVEPTGPGPNQLLQDKIVSLAENAKLDSDSELRLRCQAILTLGKIGNPDHLEKFFKLMSDPKKEVPPYAIEAVNLYLRSSTVKDLELKPQQISTLTVLLKTKETSTEGRISILRVLGVNARNFRKTHANTQTAPGVLDGMAEIKRLLTTEANPSYFLVGGCIEALGMFAQPDSVALISQILMLDYLKKSEALPSRRATVDVLDQVIVANIGDGKAASKVVEDAATVLVALLNDTKEDAGVRGAAAFYLADVRYPCYHREIYFNALFLNAFAMPAADGTVPPQDPSLAKVCRKSMEVLADRTFPEDWTWVEMKAWWDKAGKTLLTKVGG